MTLEWSAVIQVARDLLLIIGVIGGSLSIIQTFRAKPNLKYNLDCHHKCLEEFHHSVLNVDLRIDNVGERATTIRDIFLNKVVPDKYYPKEKFEI